MKTFVILRRDGWRSGEELEAAAAKSSQVGDEDMSDDRRPDNSSDRSSR